MNKHFCKYIDWKGNVMYKETDFCFDNNKIVAMNILLIEKK